MNTSPRQLPRAADPDQRGAEPRLYQRTAALLAARVADGSLPPGTWLLESRLAAQLGTSRGPTRQALARLAEQGLLRKAPGRGYLVVGRAAGSARAPAADAPGLERLAPAASWQRVQEAVARAIVERTPFSAWRLVESDLARHFGVSRTVAREVIARLHERGLLHRDGRGHWVAPALTARLVAELYTVRALLEPAALVLAAAHLPPPRVRAARRRVERAMERAESLDGPALDALEADLHGRLLQHCPNRTLLAAVRQHQSLLVAHSFLYTWMPRLFPAEPFLPEHLAVLRALEAGRVNAAAEALGTHLTVSLDRAIARIEQVKRAPLPPGVSYLVAMPVRA